MSRRALVAAVLLIAGGASPRPEAVASPETQFEMHQQASDDARAAEAELEQVRHELAKVLDADDARVFDAADRAFVAYRKAEVAAETYRCRGGTLEPTEACAVWAFLTRQRTRRLKALLDEDRTR